jgi:hypothetical protein
LENQQVAASRFSFWEAGSGWKINLRSFGCQKLGLRSAGGERLRSLLVGKSTAKVPLSQVLAGLPRPLRFQVRCCADQVKERPIRARRLGRLIAALLV